MFLALPTVAALATLLPSAYAAEPYSTWMSDTFITKDIPLPRSYPQAVLYRGIEAVYNVTGDTSYFNYLQTSLDAIVDADGNLGDGYSSSKLSLDDLRVGPTLLYLYRETGDERYKTAASQLREQLDIQPRTPSGGFWHRKPAYPDQMWLDGIYMALPFYAEWTGMFDATNEAIWDDIILQFDLIEEHCRNTTSNLLAHGYDESKVASWADPVTGASPHVWNRAVGWYAMALVDMLDYLPVEHAGHTKLVGYMDTLADGLKRSQDATGGWWLIMDEPYPGMEGNYIETSGTAMFAYALLKGGRLGYIDSATYEETATKAYDLLTEKYVIENSAGELDWEGTVSVGSLKGDASYEYYITQPLTQNDLKGVGTFIFLSVEKEALGA
ncbi:hypothetical protein V493_00352 [Pseudogymnoascus sp. VKM F-4281 (FW-2241)]|nr:hypothetical protein V493_00352 [Pseudogymnoascus sp. VKM F-4281 (FW-2241)]